MVFKTNYLYYNYIDYSSIKKNNFKLVIISADWGVKLLEKITCLRDPNLVTVTYHHHS